MPPRDEPRVSLAAVVLTFGRAVGGPWTSSNKTIGLLFAIVFLLGSPAFAQDAAPSEYDIKSAFIFNFAKFVEWPSTAFAGSKAPLVIGIVGQNVFGATLEKTIHGKLINEHPLEFKEFHSVADATNCHILFISPSEKERLPEIFKQLRGTTILTVGEMEHFADSGGMINFFVDNNKVRFQINNDEAAKARLKISARLLSLAQAPAH